MCNITGDSIGAAVVEKFSLGDFDEDFDRDAEVQDPAAVETFISEKGLRNFGETKM